MQLCMPLQIDEQLIHNWIARRDKSKYKKNGETKWINEQAEGKGGAIDQGEWKGRENMASVPTIVTCLGNAG